MPDKKKKIEALKKPQKTYKNNKCDLERHHVHFSVFQD